MKWKKITLKSIFDLQMGKTPLRGNTDFWNNGEHDWLSISDLSSFYKFTEKSKEKISTIAAKSTGIKIVPAGTVIMSFKLSVGKTVITTKDVYTNEAIMAFIDKGEYEVDSSFIYHLFTSLDWEKGKNRAAKGITLNKESLENTEIPLPPLGEQRRIATILDKADAICRKRQEALKLADAFVKSVFLDMFGDPVLNPKGWEVKPLGKIGAITTGNTPARIDESNYGNYIEWVKSDNLNTPFHTVTSAREMLSRSATSKARIVNAGSILVTCIAGSRECIGNAAIADRSVAFNQQINAISPFDDEMSYFIYCHIIFFKKIVQQKSTDGMKGLVSKGNFEQIELIAPPVEIVKEFNKFFATQLKATSQMRTHLAEAEHMKKALQQQFFG